MNRANADLQCPPGIEPAPSNNGEHEFSSQAPAQGQDKLLSAMKSWPAIEGAHATPQMSLPQMGR